MTEQLFNGEAEILQAYSLALQSTKCKMVHTFLMLYHTSSITHVEILYLSELAQADFKCHQELTNRHTVSCQPYVNNLFLNLYFKLDRGTQQPAWTLSRVSRRRRCHRGPSASPDMWWRPAQVGCGQRTRPGHSAKAADRSEGHLGFRTGSSAGRSRQLAG